VITRADLLVRATALTTVGFRCLLGITGPPGSGKSTLAASLAEAIGPDRTVVVSMDGFHIADAVLRLNGLRHLKGAPQTFDRAGFASAIARLKAATDTVYLPVFDRDREDSVAAALAVPASIPLVIVEGNYLLTWPEVRQHLLRTWYVDPPRQQRVEALIARHVAHGKSPEQAREWVHRTDELNADLIAKSRQDADLVVDSWL